MTKIEEMLYEAVATGTRQDKINAWFAKWSDQDVIQSQMASTCELLDEAKRQADLRREPRRPSWREEYRAWRSGQEG
jgi:hypothetical protein